MDKCALYITRPGMTFSMVQHGYVDALRSLGWKVYCCDPQTKLGCRKLIEQYNVRLIFAHSKYGIRQLPVDVINANNVIVFLNVLPLNSNHYTIDGPYEYACCSELNIIQHIKNIVLYTHIEEHMWSKYLSGWLDSDHKLVHIPFAGNLLKAFPPIRTFLTDVAMVANLAHKPVMTQKLILPLFKRLAILDYNYQVFGDDIWTKIGLYHNGPLLDCIDKLAHIYATARVCPNIHTKQQVDSMICVNERLFTIALCGGIQVVNNPLAHKYLGEHSIVAQHTTNFIGQVIDIIQNYEEYSPNIMETIEYVAQNHTYFNRLAALYNILGDQESADHINRYHKRLANRHCWKMEALLSATERGIPYGQNIVGAA